MTTPPELTTGQFAIAFLGRFLSVLGTTALGLLVGLLVGAYRATNELAAIPTPAKMTLGMESSGLTPIFVWAINLLLGGLAGLALGLLVGVVGMVAWRRSRG